MARLERWLLLMGLRKRQTHILEGERVAHVRASHCAIFPNNTDRPQTTLHQRKIDGLRRPFRPVTRVTRFPGDLDPSITNHPCHGKWGISKGSDQEGWQRLSVTQHRIHILAGSEQDAMVHPGWHLQTPIGGTGLRRWKSQSCGWINDQTWKKG